LADFCHAVFEDHPRLSPDVRFSRSAQAKPGTRRGTATESVLQELGYRDDQLADLRARKVIG
jgi:crotonobetainyl-CoA:carnitine CoA-transferase CaiB-like acyl-CoA transferase